MRNKNQSTKTKNRLNALSMGLVIYKPRKK